jgi:hypothetical protein
VSGLLIPTSFSRDKSDKVDNVAGRGKVDRNIPFKVDWLWLERLVAHIEWVLSLSLLIYTS